MKIQRKDGCRLSVNPDTTAKDIFLTLCEPEPNSGCWFWIGSRGSNGYGEFWLGEEHCLAHRASWWIHFNEWPGTLCVLHKCNNRLCVNPKHLYLGTKKDNAHDTIRSGKFVCNKGRKLGPNLAISGEKNHLSKLTNEQVLEFREKTSRSADPVSITKKYSKRFGVSYPTLWSVLKRETWKHI